MRSILEFADLAVVKFDALHFAIYDRLEILFGVSHTTVTSVVDDAILFGVQFLSCYLVVLLTLGPVLLTGYLFWRLTLNLFSPTPPVRTNPQQVVNAKSRDKNASGGIERTKSGSCTSPSPRPQPGLSPATSSHSQNLVVGNVVTGQSAAPRTPSKTLADRIRNIFTPSPGKTVFHARARLAGKSSYRLVKVDDSTMACLQHGVESVLNLKRGSTRGSPRRPGNNQRVRYEYAFSFCFDVKETNQRSSNQNPFFDYESGCYGRIHKASKCY
jgi:hypothetical protein